MVLTGTQSLPLPVLTLEIVFGQEVAELVDFHFQEFGGARSVAGGAAEGFGDEVAFDAFEVGVDVEAFVGNGRGIRSLAAAAVRIVSAAFFGYFAAVGG